MKKKYLGEKYLKLKKISKNVKIRLEIFKGSLL
jgi:hypothetical protein